MSLKLKMLGLIVMMGLLPALGTPILLSELGRSADRQRMAVRTVEGQSSLERINGLVYAVVMDSRGIYMSETSEKAKPFADGMLASLKDLGAEANKLSALALPAVADETKKALAVLGDFITFRTEMVRLAREESPQAARVVGDNDINRANRSALNKALRELSGRYEQSAKDNLAAAEGAREATTTTILVVGVLPLIAIALGLVLILRGLAQPLDRIKASILRLAAGETTAQIFGTTRRDEIGAIAGAVLVFQRNLLETDRMRVANEAERVAAEAARKQAEADAIAAERAIVAQSFGTALSRLAAKDLTARVTEAVPEVYGQLRDDFNAAAEALAEALSLVREGATSITSSSRELALASDNLARRTETQAASLEETAAAVDEITATVKRAAEGALHARDVVDTSRQGAERTGDVVKRAVRAMDGIEASSRQITQIISVIDEIAFQTSLLALNAGVEAARAGEAGRGFAVVASEVRGLAQRSAEAAKEIKVLIETSSQQVAGGVKLVAETGAALETIITQVGEINQIMSDIANGAQEQSTGLDQINSAINAMDQSTQQNAAMVEESTAANHSLSQEAERLEELMAQFTIEAPKKPQRHNGARSKSGKSAKRDVAAVVPPHRRAAGRAAVTQAAAGPREEHWADF